MSSCFFRGQRTDNLLTYHKMSDVMGFVFVCKHFGCSELLNVQTWKLEHPILSKSTMLGVQRKLLSCWCRIFSLTLSLPNHLLCWCYFHLKNSLKEILKRPEMFIFRTQRPFRMYQKLELTQEVRIQHELHTVYFDTSLTWRPKGRERL